MFMKPMDCDVFCTKEFVFDGEVCITGNFYAAAPVYGTLLEAGENIHINSSNVPVDIDIILSHGSVRIVSPSVNLRYLYAEDGADIITKRSGKELEDILFGDDSCEHYGPDGEYEPVS